MAKIVSALNGGVAEVDDKTAALLVESGHWYAESAAPVAKRTRTRKAPVPKTEE